jgi:hypothetical protein
MVTGGLPERLEDFPSMSAVEQVDERDVLAWRQVV